MKLLNRDDILACYTMEDALDDVQRAFEAQVAGKTDNPLRTKIVVDDRRTQLIMSCYSPLIDATAVKTICLYPDNAKAGLPTAPAQIVLIDGKTGMTSAVLDGDTVTKMRTGASSGVAFRHLGVSHPTIATVIGTGGQAYTQALATLAAAPTLTDLRISGLHLDQVNAFIDNLKKHPLFPTHTNVTIQAFDDNEAAVSNADLIVIVTSATQPVVSASNIKPGATISCVGSYQPHMQECGSDIMAKADKIFCDDVEAALEESGDLIIPLGDGTITRDKIVGSVADVSNGSLPGREDDQQIIVYETVGIGAQDLFAAAHVVEVAGEAGMRWS